MKPHHIRVEEGKERQDYWDKLTAKEKLASLDTRLGVGVGAKRQREKLAKEVK